MARFPIGRRWRLGGKNLTTIVRETGRPARVDHYAASSSGSIGEVGRESRFRSTVGAPILVEGRLWGTMVVGSTRAAPLLPVGAEDRLAQFTDLLATAVANAEAAQSSPSWPRSRQRCGGLQRSWRAGCPQEEVFAAVTAEVVRLLPVDFARMGRFEPDGTLAVLAASGRTDNHFPVGRRLAPEWKNLGRIVARTGRSARVDSVADSPGLGGVSVREMGVRSAVATPVIVEGRLWGVIAAGSTLEQPLPVESEARLGSFTELVATAVANAENGGELARLVGQQAALRRVATLVARGAPPEEVFAAVIDEVSQLFPVDYAGMARYDSDGMFTAVAARGTTHFPLAAAWPLAGRTLPRSCSRPAVRPGSTATPMPPAQ